MPDGRCGPIRRLTAAALDRYASQLALPRGPGETSAPIRARVQHELATVRAEQNARASSGPADPPRRYDASGLTAGELDRTRRELAASLALARPDSPARVPILAHLAATGAELAAQAAARPARLTGSVILPGARTGKGGKTVTHRTGGARLCGSRREQRAGPAARTMAVRSE